MMLSRRGGKSSYIDGRSAVRSWSAVLGVAMVASLLGLGAAQAQQGALCTPPAAADAFDPAKPNLGQLKLQLRYYQCSKKYEEDVRTELAKAPGVGRATRGPGGQSCNRVGYRRNIAFELGSNGPQ